MKKIILFAILSLSFLVSRSQNNSPLISFDKIEKYSNGLDSLIGIQAFLKYDTVQIAYDSVGIKLSLVIKNSNNYTVDIKNPIEYISLFFHYKNNSDSYTLPIMLRRNFKCKRVSRDEKLNIPFQIIHTYLNNVQANVDLEKEYYVRIPNNSQLEIDILLNHAELISSTNRSSLVKPPSGNYKFEVSLSIYKKDEKSCIKMSKKFNIRYLIANY